MAECAKKAHSALRTAVGCNPGRAKSRQSQMVLLAQKMEMFGGLRTEGWLFYLRTKVLNLALRPKRDKWRSAQKRRIPPYELQLVAIPDESHPVKVKWFC